MSQLAVLVIGAGHLGKIHLKLLHQHDGARGPSAIRCAGVVDPCPQARQAVTDQWALPTFEDLSEVNIDFDAAIIATPTRQHAEVAQQLLERGKHLLIEKPLALTGEESQMLVDTAAATGRVVQVGHVERFNPAFTAAAKQIERVRYMEFHRSSRFTGRSTDIGAVLDLMIHDIDLMLSLVDSPVAQVDAMGVSVFGDHEDVAQARIRFANGTVANLWASRCSYVTQRQMKLVGTNGFVQADLNSRKLTRLTVPAEIQGKQTRFNRLSAEARQKLVERLFEDVLPMAEQELPPSNPLLDEQADFFQAIRSGRPNRVPVADGHAALLVAQQILSAIKFHSWSENPFGPRGPLIDIDQFVADEVSRQAA